MAGVSLAMMNWNTHCHSAVHTVDQKCVSVPNGRKRGGFAGALAQKPRIRVG